jgi:hypothetical protein
VESNGGIALLYTNEQTRLSNSVGNSVIVEVIGEKVQQHQAEAHGCTYIPAATPVAIEIPNQMVMRFGC